MFDMARVALNITHWRKRRNMTQLELADRLGVSFQAVSNWERGLAMPDISKLPELAALFGITIDTLLTDGIVTDDEVASDHSPARVQLNEPDAREREAERSTDEAAGVRQRLPDPSIEELDAMAEKYYVEHNVILFPAIVKEISDVKVKELIKRAIEDHDLVFLNKLKSECGARFGSHDLKTLLPDIPVSFWDEQLEKYVGAGDIPFVNFVVSSASPEARARLKRTALLQGKSVLYSMLD